MKLKDFFTDDLTCISVSYKRFFSLKGICLEHLGLVNYIFPHQHIE